MVIIFLEKKLGVNPYLAKSWKIFPKNGRSLRAFSGKYFQAFSKLLISGHQWGVILEKFSRRILSLPSQEKNKKNCLEKISRYPSESWRGFSEFEFIFQILDYGKIFQKKPWVKTRKFANMDSPSGTIWTVRWWGLSFDIWEFGD